MARQRAVTTFDDTFVNRELSTRLDVIDEERTTTTGSGGGGGGSSSSSSSNTRPTTNTSNSSNSSTTSSTSFTYESKLLYNAYLVKGIVRDNEVNSIFTLYSYTAELFFGALFGLSDSDKIHSFITSNLGNIPGKRLINTIDLEVFISTLNSVLSTTGEKMFVEFTYDDTDKYWNLSIKFHPDAGDDILLYTFYVVFEPGYTFTNKQASLNNITQLYKVGSNIVSAKFLSLANSHNVSIKYATVRDYLWFKITTYNEDIKRIKIKPSSGNTLEINFENQIKFESGAIKFGSTTRYDNASTCLKITPASNSNIYVFNESTNAKGIDIPNNPLNPEVGYKFYYNLEDNGETKEYTLKLFVPLFDTVSSTTTLKKAETANIFNVTFDFAEIESDSNKPKPNNVEQSISSDNAIKVFSNTHSKIDFIKNDVKLHDTLLAGEHLIAIYKLNDNESSFNGNITLFYGDQIIYSNEYILNHNLTNRSSHPITLSYYVISDSNCLKVYLKADIDIKLRKFINVFLSDEESSYEDSSYDLSHISQDTVTLHSIDINIPPVSIDDDTVFIDDFFNSKTKHYTYYTKLQNKDGSYSYYGVRAYGKYDNDSDSVTYFSNELYKIGIEGVTYNVPAKIVKLTPKKEQRNIYSFKTGPELILLNKKLTNIEISESSSTETGYTITGYELLNNSHILSYEYIVDNKVPNDTSAKYNLDFYTAYAVAGKNQIDSSLIKNSESSFSYSMFGIEYTYSYNIVTNIYKQLSVTDNKLRPNETIYEYNYKEYTKAEGTKLIPGNVYEEIIEYVKIQAKEVPFSKFKDTINGASSTSGEDTYYKYDSSTKNYVKYSKEDLKSLSSTPINLYVKYIYYLKTPETGTLINGGASLSIDGLNGETLNYNFARYYLDVSYSRITNSNDIDINKFLQSNDKYYQFVENTYIPVTGLVKDGTVDYYGFKLTPFVDLKSTDLVDLSKHGELTLNNLLNKTFKYVFDKGYKFYVTHDYTQLLSTNYSGASSGTSVLDTIDYLTKEEITVLKTEGVDVYNYVSQIDYVEVDGNLTVYDIDLSGNTIYTTDRNLGTVIDIDKIKDKVQGLDFNQTALNKDNILRNPDSEYKIRNFAINYNDTDHIITYVVTFNGNYEKVSYEQIHYINKNGIDRSSKKLFIKKKSISLLSDDAIRKIITNVDSNQKMILTKYNIDNILYVPVFKKLTPDDLNDDTYLTTIGTNDYEYRYFYIISDTIYAVETNEITSSTTNINAREKYKGLLFNLNSQSGLYASPGSILPVYKLNIEPSKVYKESKDIHLSINKNYFKKIDKIIWSGKLSGQSSYIEINPTAETDEEKVKLNINNNPARLKELAVENDKIQKITNTELSQINLSNLKLKYDSLELYNFGVSYYLTYHNDIDRNHLIDSGNKVSSYEMYINNIKQGKNSYTDEIYFKTSFLYPSYSFNNGINIDSNGSYYTDIMAFDGAKGKISKRIYLNNHVINITKYSYEDIKEEYSQVSNLNELSTISKYDYNQYYIRKAGATSSQLTQLNESSESLSYYYKNSFDIYRKIQTSYVSDYNNIGFNQLSHNGAPVVITIGDDFYGLIFNKDIFERDTSSENTTTGNYGKKDIEFISYSLTFNSGHNFLESSYSYYLTYSHTLTPPINDFDFGDDQNTANVEALYPDYAHDGLTVSFVLSSIYNTANNEIYYNNYEDDDIRTCYFSCNHYIPSNYLYEIVELSEFTFRNYNADASLIQAKEVNTYNIETTKPFSITNSEDIVFDGTYTWVPPTYKTKILDDGTRKVIIATEGYWHKNYQKRENPFKVYSYNYFSKDEVSEINVSYNFVPYSYVLTAEIAHPKISYDYLISELTEEVKYSYIVNGFEHDYSSNNSISYENGSYYGLIHLRDVDGGFTDIKTKLYKRNSVINRTTVKEIVHQEEHTSYEYFAYKESTPLTNEKIPILYKTELIPAKNKKVQYWNSNKNSYSIKTVLESYAYYAYHYTYETIPFKVASYIYTDDLRISNFDDLGYHIDQIGYAITAEMGKESGAVEGLTTDLSYIFNNLVKQDRLIANEEIEVFKNHSYIVDSSIDSLNSETNRSLSYLSDDVKSSINNLTTKEEEAINKLTTEVVNEIVEQHNIIKDSLNAVENTMNVKLNSFENRLHDDIIGESSKEEVNTEYIRSTYTPIVEPKSNLIAGYSYSSETGSQVITVGGSSLGEILQTTLGTVSTYTVTENNEDGSYTVTTYKGFNGLANILANLSITNKIPNYDEFMVDLVPKMFASVDFEGDYNIVYDINGNVKSKEKRNPTDIAKKCIMRADILWNELKKKNIVH